MGVLLFGAPNFFVPRLPPPAVWPPSSPDKASSYDNTPLRATLERLIDFDGINAGEMRFSVGAVEVHSGNFTYFDTTTHQIVFEHIAPSGSLRPGFPATRIEPGRHRSISIYPETADCVRQSTQADARAVAPQRRCQALAR